MRPEHEQADALDRMLDEAEAVDRLLDRLQHHTTAGGIGQAHVDPGVARVVRELHQLATGTPNPDDLVQELERRIQHQIESIGTAQLSEPAGTRLNTDVRDVYTARGLGLQEVQRRELFTALRTPIVTTSLSGRVTGFNAAAVALFGSPARLYGRNIRDLLPFAPEPRDTSTAADAQGRVADATGRTVDLEVSRTVLTEAGDQGYAVYVVHDISRHAEVNRLREQLLYSVAHELRGPLMVLDNALEILHADYSRLTTDEFNHVLGTARRTTRRMRTLMEDLLSAGSIQSGHFVVVPRATELSTIVADAIEIVGPTMDSRSQQLQLELSDDAAWVLADKRYARQVLTNLLANASKYSPERSSIRIVAAPSADVVRISVGDQGPGIPPEQQARLFERFYRVRSDTDTPGVGLGLAIARSIVEAHGGSIGIDSELGSGTSVWFTCPKAPRPAQTDTVPESKRD